MGLGYLARVTISGERGGAHRQFVWGDTHLASAVGLRGTGRLDPGDVRPLPGDEYPELTRSIHGDTPAPEGPPKSRGSTARSLRWA